MQNLVAEELAGRAGKVYDDLDIKERMTFYDKAYKGLSEKRFRNKPDPDDFADGGEVSGTFGMLSDNADISKIIDQKVTDYENEYMQRTGKIPPEFYGDEI